MADNPIGFSEESSFEGNPELSRLFPEHMERDFLKEGYQKLNLRYFLTCQKCGTRFSMTTKPSSFSQNCVSCGKNRSQAETEFVPGSGETYFPFSPEKGNKLNYLLLPFGRMTQKTFLTLSLVGFLAALIPLSGFQLGPAFIFLFLQMVKREHDLGKSWKNLIPVLTLFCLWYFTFLANLGLLEKLAFIPFSFLLTLTLINFFTATGTKGPNKFGPVPGLFEPFEKDSRQSRSSEKPSGSKSKKPAREPEPSEKDPSSPDDESDSNPT